MKMPWRILQDRIDEARRAADVAEHELEETKARRITVEREAAKLRYHREANHLTELFDQLISGRG